MAEDLIVLVDGQDKPLGYGTKEETHTVHDGKLGHHHRGLTVLVHDGKGKVLLQHRKHKIFDDVWDLAGSTHPYLRNNKQETYEEAALRCLRTEYTGFEDASVANSSVSVNYEAVDPRNKKYCENEFCRLIISVHDTDVSHNPENAYGHEWVQFETLISDMGKNPGKYAPWLLDLVAEVHQDKPDELSSLYPIQASRSRR